MNHLIRIRVNGMENEIRVESRRTLLEVLREDLVLMGTKRACDEGECGACSVLLENRLVNACLVLAVEADGKEVLTIEGLRKGNALHPLQASFIEQGAIQCGYCTPGMILAAKALLDEVSQPSEDQIKKAIEGNLCRCTGYTKIIRAIRAASETGENQ